MAAVTPSAVIRENIGSLTLHIATFASTLDFGDTWASGIEGILGAWITETDAPTTNTDLGSGCSVSGSTVTMWVGQDNQAVKLFVVSKS